MLCMDCDAEIEDQADHWADCEKAPEYVRYQAKADRRYRAGGPFSPKVPFDEHSAVNRIDRGLDEPGNQTT